MVSRETLIARGLDELGLADRSDDTMRRLTIFAELLERRAIPRGFVGPTEGDRVVARHILESAALVRFLREGAVIDVGSGAGLPGMVIACLVGGSVTLIEARARRASFLREVAHELGIGVRVVHGRAEDEAHGQLRESAENVTARALADPAAAAELTLAFASVGGAVLLPVGELAPEAVEGLAQVADLLGGGRPEGRGFEVPGLKERRWVMIVPKLRSTPERYPRSANAMRRRPLSRGVT